MLGQNIGEAPDFVEGVIERCRRDADDVRFAKIPFHITGSGSVSEVRRPPSASFLLASNLLKVVIVHAEARREADR